MSALCRKLRSKHIFVTWLWIVLSALLASSATAATPCNQAHCGKGSVVTTYAPPSEGYFACPTRQLSEYTHFVLGLIDLHWQVTGKAPQLSTVTGEPDYQGETKVMLDNYRRGADVSSFADATRQCVKGRHGVRVRVEENPPDGTAFHVSEPSGKKFWLPRAHTDKRE
jgi:hypothetical protein